MPEWVTVSYRRYEVKPYLPNPMRCFRYQKLGHTQACFTSDITCLKCGAKVCDNTICPCPVQHVSYSGAHASSSLGCSVYLQEMEVRIIHVEDCLSSPEVQKRYFELQPKPLRVTYAQDAVSYPTNSEIFTHTDSVPSEPDSDGSQFLPYQPITYPKPADPPKQPQRSTNLGNSPHPKRAVLNCTMTWWMARAKLPHPTQSHSMRT